jgi:hypothetical protein
MSGGFEDPGMGVKVLPLMIPKTHCDVGHVATLFQGDTGAVLGVPRPMRWFRPHAPLVPVLTYLVAWPDSSHARYCIPKPPVNVRYQCSWISPFQDLAISVVSWTYDNIHSAQPFRTGHGVIAMQGSVSPMTLEEPTWIGLPAVLVAVSMGMTVPKFRLAT